MSATAAKHGARGGAIVISGQLAKMGLQLVGVSVLSRILAPEDFGLVAMVAVFLAAGDLIRDFGMPTAALQAETLTHQQASNVFWASSGLGAVAAGVIALSAQFLVRLYDEPRLEAIVPVMALTLLFNGLQAQLQVQLARSMRFFAISATGVAGQAVGLAIAILGAVAGWGYWALVAQLVVSSASLLMMQLIATRWRPLRPRRRHGSSKIFKAGSEFGLAQFTVFLANNVDSLVIGRRWGANELGTYNRAFQLYSFPRDGLLVPLTPVVIPSLNSARAEGKDSTDLLLRIQFVLSFVLTYAYLMLAVNAYWLIPLVLGDQWLGSIQVLRNLAVGGMFGTFALVNFWVFVIENQSRQLLLANLVTKPIGIVLVIAAAPLGINAVAIAFSIGIAISWLINLAWLARTAGTNPRSFFWLGMRVLGAAAAGYVAATLVVGGDADSSGALRRLMAATSASCVYLIAILVVPGGWREVALSVRTLRRVFGRSPGQ